MSEKLALKNLERQWDKLYLERWEYYRKKSEPDVYEKKPLLKKILDTDVKLYLAADDELQNLRFQMDGKEELIDFLKRTMEQISQRQWHIRNAIENYKFLNGDK
jgi:transcription elongation factor GreA-like protein